MKDLLFYLSDAKGYEPPDSANRLRQFYAESSENAMILEDLWEKATTEDCLDAIRTGDAEFNTLLEQYGLYVQCYWEKLRAGEKPELKMSVRIYSDYKNKVACIKVWNLPIES